METALEPTVETITEILSESASELAPAPLEIIMPDELRVLLLVTIICLALIFAALLCILLFRR